MEKCFKLKNDKCINNLILEGEKIKEEIEHDIRSLKNDLQSLAVQKSEESGRRDLAVSGGFMGLFFGILGFFTGGLAWIVSAATFVVSGISYMASKLNLGQINRVISDVSQKLNEYGVLKNKWNNVIQKFVRMKNNNYEDNNLIYLE
jgi:hypothetical protein